jgi:predicted DsbA family dithiol-disulfide isomerase
MPAKRRRRSIKLADFDAQKKQLVEGSPTFVLDEGRQKLYGNVGYRILEGNIQELLTEPGQRPGWCYTGKYPL